MQTFDIQIVDLKALKFFYDKLKYNMLKLKCISWLSIY